MYAYFLLSKIAHVVCSASELNIDPIKFRLNHASDTRIQGVIEDVEKLFSLADNKYAVMCVKHDHKPNKKTKMDGSLQSNYPRKNWSSLVLWNCSHKANKKVNLKMINSKTGKYLHRFGWLKNKEIGSIPVEWNWLVGWYKEKKINKIKALHFTEGGPWFKSCKIDKYSKMWVKFAKKYSLNFTKI